MYRLRRAVDWAETAEKGVQYSAFHNTYRTKLNYRVTTTPAVHITDRDVNYQN